MVGRFLFYPHSVVRCCSYSWLTLLHVSFCELAGGVVVFSVTREVSRFFPSFRARIEGSFFFLPLV